MAKCVTCAHCKRQRPRTYYECTICFHYYLCEACYRTNIHDGHNMEIKRADNLLCYGCLENTSGDCFDCNTCLDYFLCQGCHDIGVNHKHELTHCFPVCDGCKEPVLAIRYKCMTCPNYGLCSACHDQGTHSEHDMDRFVHGDIKDFVREGMRCFQSQEEKMKKLSPVAVCRGCKGLVLAGLYRCQTCPDYGLCTPCHDKDTHREHEMDRVTPGLYLAQQAQMTGDLHKSASWDMVMQNHEMGVGQIGDMPLRMISQNASASFSHFLKTISATGKQVSSDGKYLYHYSRVAAKIVESGFIRPSLLEGNIKFGKGVYFTELPPEQEDHEVWEYTSRRQ